MPDKLDKPLPTSTERHPARGDSPSSSSQTKPTPPADDLGQEGVQRAIKPNTTKNGERQDRGP